jgi:ATP diphosphatase
MSNPSSDNLVAKPVDRLLKIMALLRDPDRGCEWDLAQDFESISRYTIEEAYEVADAIKSGNTAEIRDELGDLMLQVVFHSQIAADQNLFNFDDVCTAVSNKMERRHPHIFGDQQTDDVRLQWEQIKAVEREKKGENGALSGIALSLPALLRAQKIQARVARVGFDWPDENGPKAKILEEMAEIEAAETFDHLAEEVGDLLFAVVNYARHLGVDAEVALAAANDKFTQRFNKVERLSGGNTAGLGLDILEEYWEQAKADEKKPA